MAAARGMDIMGDMVTGILLGMGMGVVIMGGTLATAVILAILGVWADMDMVTGTAVTGMDILVGTMGTPAAITGAVVVTATGILVGTVDLATGLLTVIREEWMAMGTPEEVMAVAMVVMVVVGTVVAMRAGWMAMGIMGIMGAAAAIRAGWGADRYDGYWRSCDCSWSLGDWDLDHVWGWVFDWGSEFSCAWVYGDDWSSEAWARLLLIFSLWGIVVMSRWMCGGGGSRILILLVWRGGIGWCLGLRTSTRADLNRRVGWPVQPRP
jgi:hypothetical protein